MPFCHCHPSFFTPHPPLLTYHSSPITPHPSLQKGEKQPREGLLTNELEYSVKYLNQFLPPEHNMRYIHIDMARINKKQGESGGIQRGQDGGRGGMRDRGVGKRD